MHDRALALDAAIRALRNDADLETTRPVIGDSAPACVLSSAPPINAILRIVAARRRGRTATLTPQDIADPNAHAMVRTLVGALDQMMCEKRIRKKQRKDAQHAPVAAYRSPPSPAKGALWEQSVTDTETSGADCDAWDAIAPAFLPFG